MTKRAKPKRRTWVLVSEQRNGGLKITRSSTRKSTAVRLLLLGALAYFVGKSR